MRVWRTSLRKTKSTIISWAGSNSNKNEIHIPCLHENQRCEKTLYKTIITIIQLCETSHICAKQSHNCARQSHNCATHGHFLAQIQRTTFKNYFAVILNYWYYIFIIKLAYVTIIKILFYSNMTFESILLYFSSMSLTLHLHVHALLDHRTAHA